MKFAFAPNGWLAGTCLLLLVSLKVGSLSGASKGHGTTSGELDSGEEEEEEEACEEMKPYANFGFDLTGTGINLVDGQNPPQPKRAPGQPVQPNLPPHVITHPTSPETCDPQRHGYMCKFVKNCGNMAQTRRGYIFNGQRAREAEFPSFVQLKTPDGRACGATIVTDWHVVTAAHCVVRQDTNHTRLKPPTLHHSLFTVFAGSIERWPRPDPHRQEYPVAKICVSKVFKFTPNVFVVRGDVAIIRVGRRIVFNERVQPACWPYKFRTKPQMTGDNSNCYAIGMGEAGRRPVADGSKWPDYKEGPEDQLMKWRVRVDTCSKFPMDPDQTHFCVRQHKDHGPERGVICDGDSGGPVFCSDPSGRFILSGVISWGPAVCSSFPEAGVMRLDEILEYAQLSSGECAFDNHDVPPERPSCDQTRDGPMCAKAATCGTTKGVPYVEGGAVARAYEFPFYVSVRANGIDKHCSGALVSATQVVTSKSCLTRPDGSLVKAREISIFVGSHNGDGFHEGQRQRISALSYCTSKRRMTTPAGREGNEHKLAIVTLANFVKFDQSIQPACWPYKSRNVKTLGANGRCVVLGRTKPNSNSVNTELRKNLVNLVDCNLTSGQDCYVPQSPIIITCGELGSPVVCRDISRQWILVAIVEDTSECTSAERIFASPIEDHLDTKLTVCRDTTV